MKVLGLSPLFLVLTVGFLFFWAPGAQAWSKEGHIMTCRIAQSLLDPAASEVISNLLPDYVNGDLSSLCTWADQIRILYKYRWTSPLHYINTPDEACSFDYSRDCHNPKGVKDMCVAGAVQNFTTQLANYKKGSSDSRYNMTEALLFLSHFVGDIHQPMHVGFSSDEGGNTIELRWYRHKSNLHHVWDREIILTAEKLLYNNDMDLFQEDIQKNFTNGIWSDDLSSWKNCSSDDLSTCPTKWAEESIDLACKWGYKGVTPGQTLSDEYFNSRFPIVAKRIAQGGVRLSLILNRLFGHQPTLHHHSQEMLATT
ncbi:endonuclease 1-like [Telopea speciosissima]|uniref:endonuclease 1-like n=1 Tax=Telopea speciosissima TaxID=54955 RepID=UPI001CC38F97|nr:endonuclease 1-like [Telopea speciosissima]